jgi:hypothetical protein
VESDIEDLVEYRQRGGDINRWMAECTAKEARAGDTVAALEILQSFANAIERCDERTWSAPIHWAYARYIADAFEKIIRAAMRSPRWGKAKWSDAEDGPAQEDANLALGIKNSAPGRRKGTKTFDTGALAAAFNLLLVHDFKPKEAKVELKRTIGAHVRTIENADSAHEVYRYYRTQALDENTRTDDRDFAVEFLKAGAKPFAKRITLILAARKSRKPVGKK